MSGEPIAAWKAPTPVTRVVVPSANPAVATLEWAARVGAEVVDVSSDDHAYWRLLRSLWHQGQGWLNVEHDLVPTAAQADELLACEGDWCAVAYRVHQTHGVVSLGFMKFGPALIARHPDLLEIQPPAYRHWGGLDGSIVTGLERRGEHYHRHDGEVVHHHREVISHPSLYRRTTLAKLQYLGDGTRYLHEDLSAGIPPIPAADFETDNESVISLCVGSGLYKIIEAESKDQPDVAPKKSREGDAEASAK